MTISFEWAGARMSTDAEDQRGIDRALAFFEQRSYRVADIERLWNAYTAAVERDYDERGETDWWAISLWNDAEFEGLCGLTDGWAEMPEGISMVWK